MGHKFVIIINKKLTLKAKLVLIFVVILLFSLLVSYVFISSFDKGLERKLIDKNERK